MVVYGMFGYETVTKCLQHRLPSREDDRNYDESVWGV